MSAVDITIEEDVMTRRTRRWIRVAIGTVVTAVLVALPAAAQAGIIFNSID
jgi:hypothetical protein